MSKKFKIKTAKEIGEEWRENWDKFVQGFNDFFGIKSNQNVAKEYNTKETAFDITPEELRKNFDENGNLRTDIAIIDNEQEKPTSLQIWDENWRNFSKDMMNSFNDMKQKADEINQRNFKKLEE